MIYKGQRITVRRDETNIAELVFDNTSAAINKFDKATLGELDQAVIAIKNDQNIIAVVVSSNKKDFIVGADITEFLDYFAQPDEVLLQWLQEANRIFSAFEDLPVPTVSMIDGNALGGGFEMCLATDYRIMTPTAMVGLPEVKLGIFPGFGGTVRLSRLTGADNAIEWICQAGTHNADEALRIGAVDAVVSSDLLKKSAVDLVQKCCAGEFDFKARRQQKKEPMSLTSIESMMVFETAKGFVAGKAGPHYPAPVAAIKAMQAHADQERDAALQTEAKHFVKMAKTPVARHLVNLFLGDQLIRKKAKTLTHDTVDINQSAVVGAGIMGGGIAYQSAYKNIPVIMKDIAQQGLDHGLKEAGKLLCKQITRKKIDAGRMSEILSHITPTLHYADFDKVDIVIEAVVENEKIKQQTLQDLEKAVKKNTVICSNTSTLSISRLAESLKNPENFCGMHFFNPVHRMPLVEIIRGEKTSDQTIAATVAYAQQIGKTPIVVNDCPGFFVNRVLFPYFAGLAHLVHESVDFHLIDKVMEKFGWPMGPAYLLDVVGLDTAVHAESIMAKGFPGRMAKTIKSPIDMLVKQERLGQKNNLGFYRYAADKKGRPVKKPDSSVQELLYNKQSPSEMDEETIVNRMMIPMAMESIRCLEENIINSPTDADMALIYGLGFPPFRGGIFRYIDDMGLDTFVSMADRFSAISPIYEPTDQLRTLAEKNTAFYTHYAHKDNKDGSDV